MYRQVLARTARARGWDVTFYDAKRVMESATVILGVRTTAVLRGPRAIFGPPWARDHRVALAATIVGMAQNDNEASQRIDERIRELGDWRGETLAKVRNLITEADPDIVEEWKWAKATSPGTPVWSHDGGVCTGETYKNVVKLTFFKGASLDDPAGLFNSSLEGKVRRAIDIKEGEEIDEAALKRLVEEAVALNRT
jgi:hypothetical protein